MHISLDQAIGRQPRLNRVGQSLLNIAPEASVAYSLRSLTGGDPKVVRVRRASDNHEQDFTASGVSSGALVDFVNADGTQFMNFDGTDDDITTPALLPATDDFTLTIVAFIESTPSSAMGIFGSAAGGTGRHFLQLNTDGTVRFFAENLGPAATTTATIIEKSINTIVLTRTGQTFEITLNGGGAASQTGSSVVLTTGNNNIGDPYVGVNFQGVITSLSVASTTWDGTIANVPAGSTVNGSPSTNALNDGFVNTWYDQSGNGFNAVADADVNEPEIVNSGILLTDGIKFSSGTNLELSGTGLDIFKNTQYAQVFYAIKINDTSANTSGFFEARTGLSNARFLLRNSTSTDGRTSLGGRRLDGDSFSSFQSNVGHSNEKIVLTGFINYADAEAFIFQNGTEIGSRTSFLTAGATSDTRSSIIAIGRAGANLTAEFDAEELIIFNTDQTANRTAIETNMINHYG